VYDNYDGCNGRFNHVFTQHPFPLSFHQQKHITKFAIMISPEEVYLGNMGRLCILILGGLIVGLMDGYLAMNRALGDEYWRFFNYMAGNGVFGINVLILSL